MPIQPRTSPLQFAASLYNADAPGARRKLRRGGRRRGRPHQEEKEKEAGGFGRDGEDVQTYVFSNSDLERIFF